LLGELATTSVNNNELLITATSTSGGQGTYTKGTASTQWVVGHKVLAMCDVKSSTTGFTVRMSLANNTQVKNVVGTITISSSWQTLSGVCDISEETKGTRICCVTSALAIGGTMSVRNVKAIDLTQMFGSTIADYIYTLEQNETGAGVALFKSIYPDDYYEYNTGTNEMVGSREGQTATINLGQTVYGGTLDVTNGKLTVTHGIVDLGTLSWGYDNTGGKAIFYSSSIRGLIKPPARMGIVPNVIAEIFKTVNAYSAGTPNPNDNQISVNTDGSIWVNDLSYTTSSSFKTAMNGVQLVYELATPVEYQLTPAQLTQLLGENNVWADSGNCIELEYFVKLN
jgi:hypothetical protein